MYLGTYRHLHRKVVLLGILAITLSVPCFVAGRKTFKFLRSTFDNQRFHAIKSQDRQVIDALANRETPRGLDPRLWELAHTWTVTGFANVCFDTDHVSLAEMERFDKDLKAEAEAGPSRETLLWIWDRLARTGKDGRDYVARFKPYVVDILDEAGRQGRNKTTKPDKVSKSEMRNGEQ